MASSKLPNCQACGLCCITQRKDDTGVADLLKEDVEQLQPHERARLYPASFILNTLANIHSVPKLAATTREFRGRDGVSRCTFLSGSLANGPGKNSCRCRIYEHRPQVCREFKPGSSECREVVRDWKYRISKV